MWLPVRDQNLVVGALREILEEIDAAWEPINGPSHEDAWTDEALSSHPIWIAQRGRARRALEMLGVERDDKSLFGNV